MKKLYYITLITGIILFQNCAQISAPTGGEPDKDFPVLDSIGTVPSNYSTEFSGNKIVLTFDEYFVLKNPESTVFFSPRIDNEPEYIVKGKTLTILLNNELKANTTYTINFGDAISDYTVGNKIPDFKYVFSTGTFIDSMKTEGKVIDAFTGKPISDVLVMLYENTEVSIVSKERPIYYTLSNKEGAYSLTNLKAGSYKLFALKDENRNFLYDLPNEKVGTIDNLIDLTYDSAVSHSPISLFTKDYIKQSVTNKKYEYPGKLTLTFARPVQKWGISFLDSIPVEFLKKEMNENRDSLVLWGVNLGKEKSVLTVAMDTTKETINVYPFKNTTKNKELNQLSVSRAIDATEPLKIEFNRPISKVNDALIPIKKDTTSIPIDSITIEMKTLLIYFAKKEDKSYRYAALPNAIEDLFQTTNKDTLSSPISVKKSSFYGSFTLKFIPKKDSVNYIVSLLDEKGEAIKTKWVKGNTTLTFSKLTPGKYSVKAIEDLNSNKKWDTGNYYLKKKPELVFYFPIDITIRSNWEMAESWEI